MLLLQVVIGFTVIGCWYMFYSDKYYKDRLTVTVALSVIWNLYFRVVGWGKDRWFYPPFGCSRRT
jgi:hypothetical protein